MIYFDNAATGGKKPDAVKEAVREALETCANPGRSGHRLSLFCAERVYRARKDLSDYFGGYGAERVAFTQNCTEALNLMIGAVHGHIVTTALEHNSVLRPLHARGNYAICPLRGGMLDPADVVRLVRRDTEAVVVTLASNVTGYAPDLAALRAALPARVLLLCDAAQYAGHLPLSMRESGIDAIAVAGHKGVHGIQGSGALLFSERLRPAPLRFGGTGTESASPRMPTYYPERLEAGTLSYPAIVSLHAGIARLAETGEDDLTPLTAKLQNGLSALPVVPLSQPNPFGIVSFAHARIGSEELATALSEQYDIAVRGGLHCAPLLHRAIDPFENGSVRVSFGYQNTEAEIDAFLAALAELLA